MECKIQEGETNERRKARLSCSAYIGVLDESFGTFREVVRPSASSDRILAGGIFLVVFAVFLKAAKRKDAAGAPKGLSAADGGRRCACHTLDHVHAVDPDLHGSHRNIDLFDISAFCDISGTCLV